jgi:hypothetical protein
MARPETLPSQATTNANSHAQDSLPTALPPVDVPPPPPLPEGLTLPPSEAHIALIAADNLPEWFF